jgi:biopolymer transport protein ExbB
MGALLPKIALAFEQGGIWMYPILLIQIVSIAIIIERTIALFSQRKANQQNFASQFEDNIRRGELEQVVNKASAASAGNSLSKAVVAGAQAAMNFGGREEIQGKMDEVLLHENAMIDRRTGFLTMLGNVATLTGLLGTITGMIRSFAAVSYANPAEKAALLAAGISEAMNCTAYGLIVAIPALVGYAFLQNRGNILAEDLNQSALKIFNLLSFSFDPVTMRASVTHGRANSVSVEKARDLNA